MTNILTVKKADKFMSAFFFVASKIAFFQILLATTYYKKTSFCEK